MILSIYGLATITMIFATFTTVCQINVQTTNKHSPLSTIVVVVGGQSLSLCEMYRFNCNNFDHNVVSSPG